MGCKFWFVAGVFVSSALAAPIDQSTKFETSKPEQNIRASQHSAPFWDSSLASNPFARPGYYRGVKHDPGYDSYDSRAGYGDDDYYRGNRPSSYGRDPGSYDDYGMRDYDRPSSGRSQRPSRPSFFDYFSPWNKNVPSSQSSPSGRQSPKSQASSIAASSEAAKVAPTLPKTALPSTDDESVSANVSQQQALAPAAIAPESNSQHRPQPSAEAPAPEQDGTSTTEETTALSGQAESTSAGNNVNQPRSQDSGVSDAAPAGVSRSSVWQPAVGAKYQIVLSEPVDTNAKSVRTQTVEILPSDTQIFDIDLFDNDVSDIQRMKAAGKKVICYFSAGTWEKSRPDTDSFPAAVKGSGVKRNNFGAYWDELWLDIRNPNPNSGSLPIVWQLIKSRIELAAARGCDAIDPDNMDAFDPDNSPIGFPIQKSDSVAFMRFMADEAAKNGMAIGLKNSMDMLDEVSDVIQFAVNEQCVQSSECGRYNNFLQGSRGRVGKPVFHIEYIDDDSRGPVTPGRVGKNIRMVDVTGRLMDSLCMKADGGRLSSKFSTVIKEMELGGWVQFCDGAEVTTVTRGKAEGSSRGSRGGSDSSEGSDYSDRKNGGSSRGGREGSDRSDGADSSDSADNSDAEESRGGRFGGYSSSVGQSSSSSSASSGSALGALGSGLASLFGYGASSTTASSSSTKNPYSSGHSSSMGHKGSSGHTGSSDYSSHRNTPSTSYTSSSASSASSSSSSSFSSWISSIFSPKTSSAPSTSSSPSSSSSSGSSSGGFMSGLGSFFGYGSSSSSPAATPVAAPAPQPAAASATTTCQKSSPWNPLAIFNPANWRSGGC